MARHILVLALFLTLLLALSGAGCGDSDPDDIAGNYTLSVTNRDNGCGFENWTEGETGSNIELIVTQEGNNATAEIGGLVGAWVELVLGSRVFTGTVSGNSINLTLFGTNSANTGGCTYTVNATVQAKLEANLLSGTIRYIPSTNDSPECGVLNNCATWQAFNGTRPPM